MKWAERYEVFKILRSLRENVGDSDFGLRVQGLLAHTLMRLGMSIVDVKPQGHPDIVSQMENRLMRLEVEAVVGKGRKRIIAKEDLEAIRPLITSEIGYLAILDYGIAVQCFW